MARTDWRAFIANINEWRTNSSKEPRTIAEKFFDGYEGHGYMGYTEVWINPTSSEIRDASRKRQYRVTTFKNAPGKTAYTCRGWLTDKHLFIWNTESDDHMNVEAAVTKSAKEQNLSVNFSNALPVELYYFPDVHTLGIHISRWNNPRHLTDAQAVAIAQKHPAITAMRVKLHPME